MSELHSLFSHYEHKVVENTKQKLEVELSGGLSANDAKTLINDGWVVSADRRYAAFVKRVEPRNFIEETEDEL